MGEIVNLRRARKARDRRAAEQDAACNRAKFGRSASERSGADVEIARVVRTLDGARLERD